jgi:hypothetical protein
LVLTTCVVVAFFLPKKLWGNPSKKTFTLKNKRILPDDDDAAKPSIIWSANFHKFTIKRPDENGVEVEKTISCAHYYRDKFAIILKYPNMPVVRYVLSWVDHILRRVCFYS